MKRHHIIKPDYYDHFSCKGSNCRYTCCQGWNITLTKEEYRRIHNKAEINAEQEDYKHFQKLPIKHRKRSAESVIVLNEESQCPFLSQSRLCRLQCEFGEGILPATCTKYPRSNHLYLGDTFQTLSPGCERVLELSFQKQKILLTEEDKLMDALPYSSQITESLTAMLPTFRYYKDILSLCLILLQAEDTILENRILLLGIAVRHIEELDKQGKPEEIPGYIAQYLHLLDTAVDMEELLPHIEMNPLALLHNLNIAQHFQSTSDRENQKMLSNIRVALNLKITQDNREGLINFSFESYRHLKDKYRNFLTGREHFMENLMVTFLLYMNLPFCPPIGTSIWDNYMYLAWTYSIVKLSLTASMDDIHTEQDFIHHCSILMRSWAHSHEYAKKIIKSFKNNESDTLAHIATLLYS